LTPAQKTTLIKRYTQTDFHIMLLHDHLAKVNLWYGGTLSGILLYLTIYKLKIIKSKHKKLFWNNFSVKKSYANLTRYILINDLYLITSTISWIIITPVFYIPQKLLFSIKFNRYLNDSYKILSV